MATEVHRWVRDQEARGQEFTSASAAVRHAVDTMSRNG